MINRNSQACKANSTLTAEQKLAIERISKNILTAEYMGLIERRASNHDCSCELVGLGAVGSFFLHLLEQDIQQNNLPYYNMGGATLQ